MQTDILETTLPEGGQAPGFNRAPPWITIAAGVASLTVFVVLQIFVERGSNSSWVRPPGGTVHFEVDWPTVRYQLAGDVARFLGLGLATAALVVQGRGRTFWIPCALYSTAPLLLAWRDGNCELVGRLPAAIGGGWRPASTGCDSAVAAGWGPALLEVALVLLPVIILAATRRSTFREPPSGSTMSGASGRQIAFQAAGLAFVAFALWATLWAWQLAGTRPVPFAPHLPNVLPLLAFGVLLGTWRPRVAWTLPVTAALLATFWPQLPLLAFGFRISDSLWQAFVFSLPATWPFLALPVIAASWRPMAHALEYLADRPHRALVALNVLNVADALFTSFALRHEGAVEANPVVRFLGLPAKMVLVGMLSLLVLRSRPRILGWLVLVFAGVLIWHVAGFWASPR